jgi:hypothetical protein
MRHVIVHFIELFHKTEEQTDLICIIVRIIL